MRFNIEVRVSYRSREMPEDTVLALAAVYAYVALLPDVAISWCFDGMNQLDTNGARRWASVLASANRLACEAATKGWTNPAEAEIHIAILPCRKPRKDSETGWG